MPRSSITSPNYDSRDGHIIDMLVLHYTGMPTAEMALERLCDPAAKVSAHYVVMEDGAVLPLVAETQRAWHAGVASWRGANNINQRSIGIEIVNPGHEFGYRPFPEAQMQAVLALCQSILARHPIPPRNVVGHSDVAPARKQDPGELFDWAWLAANGVGVWPQDTVVRGQGSGVGKGEESAEVRRMQQALSDYGYGIQIDGVFDAVTEAVVMAFQRHFRPSQVDGVWDGECAKALESLRQIV